MTQSVRPVGFGSCCPGGISNKNLIIMWGLQVVMMSRLKTCPELDKGNNSIIKVKQRMARKFK